MVIKVIKSNNINI